MLKVIKNKEKNIFLFDSKNLIILELKKDNLLLEAEKAELIKLKENNLYEIINEKNFYDLLNVNMENYLNKMNKNKKENKLKKLTINVTKNCNLNCSYCYVKKENINLDKKVALDSIDFFINKFNEIEQILFFGGEPLLNFDVIKEIVKYFYYLFENNKINYIPDFYIITNGTIINKKILNFIKNYEIGLTVSLDYPESAHNKSRISNNYSYKMIIDNLKKIKKYVKNLGIELTYYLNHIDFNLIELYKSLYKLKFIDYLLLSYSFTKDCFQKEYVKKFKREYLELIDYYFDQFLIKNNKKIIRIIELDNIVKRIIYKSKRYYFCDAVIGTLLLDADGKIYPCQFFINSKNFLGDIYKDFKEDFNYIKNLFKEKLSKNNKKCNECWNINLCNRCAGTENLEFNSLIKNKNFELNIIEENCDFKKNLSEKILSKVSEIFSNEEYKKIFIKNWKNTYIL